MRRLGAVLAALMLGGCATAPSAAAKPLFESPPSSPPPPSFAPPPSRAPVESPLSAALQARIPQFAEPPLPIPVRLPPGPEAGWFTHIPTTQPVAFITIDDGQVKHPLAVPLLRAAKVPVTLFLEVDAIKDDPGYFRKLRAAGATIEAHTISHPELKGRSYAYQKHEICDGADRLAALYGQRPTLFRPPFGDKDRTTLRVVKDCGMKAAFFWTATGNDGKVWYQGEHRIQPGDVILMHFRKRFPDDFLAILTAIHAAGLTPARLEDYIP
jgi:peptidoglycan/xylan/chitin deacetylase (PgdA/CDA1 family)